MSINTCEDSRFSISSRRFVAEMSVHLSSVEVYYGGAPVAVPFQWESQPGTPRVRFCETPLPPLTPPPSFLFGYRKTTPSKKMPKPKGGGILQFFTSTKKKHNSHVSPASSESSSLYSTSSYSDSASSRYTAYNHRQNQRKSYDDQDGYESPISTLCFHIRRATTPKPTRPGSTESKNR